MTTMTAVDRPREHVAPFGRSLAALAGRFDRGEPHLARGPFARWPRATDGALAVMVFAVMLVSVSISELDDGDTFDLASIGDLPAGAVVLLAVAAGALWWRRARPVAVTMFVLAVMVVWAVAGYGDGQDLALVVAIYSVGRYCTDRGQSLAAVAAACSVSVVGSVVDASQRIDVLPAVVLAALPWYVGLRIRNRGDYLVLLQERAERVEAEQLAREREAVAAERSRIARELHDVVAHQVSMMTVQAGAAKTVARDDLDTAIDAMGDVERAGREALGELRQMLGVLRRDGAEPESEHLGPQPGLDDIAALVDELASTGADVTLVLDDLPDLGTTHVLAAYRIVQEAFTNIIKHAGPAPIVHLSLSLDGGMLVVDVANSTEPTVGDTPGLPPSGYGIAGMRERVTLLGGTFTAGSQPPNRYLVHARIPLEPDPT